MATVEDLIRNANALQFARQIDPGFTKGFPINPPAAAVPGDLIQAVQPGDLITAAWMNGVVAVINQLNVERVALQNQLQTVAAQVKAAASLPSAATAPSVSNATLAAAGDQFVMTLVGDGVRAADLQAVMVAGQNIVPNKMVDTANGVEVTFAGPAEAAARAALVQQASAGTLRVSISTAHGASAQQAVRLQP